MAVERLALSKSALATWTVPQQGFAESDDFEGLQNQAVSVFLCGQLPGEVPVSVGRPWIMEVHTP